MRRRDVLAAFVTAAWGMAHPLNAEPLRRARIGFLSGGDGGMGPTLTEALGKLGWRSGETLEVNERWANGDASRLPRLAAELVAQHPDVLVATGSTETMSLRAATREVPIVFLIIADPVSLGIVESIARPGGNITGFTQGPRILWGKRIELMTEFLGHPLRRLAWLGNPANAGSEPNWVDAKDAAAQIGTELLRVDVSTAEALGGAFDNVKDRDGLLVQYDFMFFVLRSRIAELAAKHRLPAVYENRSQVLAGGLMSYGGDVRDNYRHGAGYIDRILRGARPADLPIEEPSRFELVINLNTAQALGLTVPQSILQRADEVIE